MKQNNRLKGGEIYMKTITKGIKLRCYPNEEQRNQLPQLFGNNRKVWNELLAMQQELYKKNKGTDEKTYYSQYDMSGILTKMKNDDNFAYLKYSDSTALQTVCEDLHKAFKRFFQHKSGYPKFKNKYAKQSYTSKSNNKSIRPNQNHHLSIPKLGNVQIQPYEVKGRIKRATISQTPSGKYFISLIVEQNVEEMKQTGQAIGIDLGLRNLINASNGRKFKSLHFKEIDRQIAIWQRKYAKRLQKANEIAAQDFNHIQKFGPYFKDEDQFRNLEARDRRGVVQARKRLAKLYEKKANKRKDYLHKLSTELVRKYDVISFEKLNIKNMMKNHKLARAIGEQGWRMLVDMCEYKAQWYGKTVIKVNPANTTQTCNDCGYIRTGNEKLDLGVKRWACINCGVIHDRDTNAARNILDLAVK